MTVEERFWAKVRHGAADECWVWLGARLRRGYGRLHVNGHVELAHRISYALAAGVVLPDGMYVLHRCDNPPCVNPAHLFLGTHADNMVDCAAKGRLAQHPGEENGNAKLTAPQAAAIRREFAAGGISKRALARKHGIGDTCMRRLIAGLSYRELHDGTNTYLPPERAA